MNLSQISLIVRKISKFLDDYGPLLLTREKLLYFRLRTDKLLEKSLREPGCLYVGLAGGSGVGKSTLINAIARRKISHASDRRPFTDKIVAYRHVDNPHEFNNLSAMFKSPDAVHDHDDFKALTLLDLPDIDSNQLSNRNVVMQILPYLDAVIWVASPEKYADSSFYELVKDSSIHKDNFIFIINKMDQLIDDDYRDPLTRINEVVGDLAFRLKRHTDIIDPKIFCISSVLEFKVQNGSYGEFLSHEFIRFRECLTEKWNTKHIKAVKRTNLVREMEDLLADLDSDIDPEQKKKALQSVKALGETKVDLIDSQKNFFHLGALLIDRLTKILADKDASISSVTMIIDKIFLRKLNTLSSDVWDLEPVLRGHVVSVAQQRLLEAEKIQSDMISTVMLSTGIKAVDMKESLIDAVSKDCAVSAFDLSKMMVENTIASSKKLIARFSKRCQSLMLFLPIIIMVLKLSGSGSVSDLLEKGSWLNALDHVLRLLMSVFTSEGLVALVVLGILEIAIIFFMALRRLKKIEKSATGISRVVTKSLAKCMNTAIRREIDNSLSLGRKLEEGIETLSKINSESNAIHLK